MFAAEKHFINVIRPRLLVSFPAALPHIPFHLLFRSFFFLLARVLSRSFAPCLLLFFSSPLSVPYLSPFVSSLFSSSSRVSSLFFVDRVSDVVFPPRLISFCFRETRKHAKRECFFAFARPTTRRPCGFVFCLTRRRWFCFFFFSTTSRFTQVRAYFKIIGRVIALVQLEVAIGEDRSFRSARARIINASSRPIRVACRDASAGRV